MYNETFINRLKEKRTELGLSQIDIANELNISRTAITKIENGNRKATVEELGRIAYYLDVSTDWLLGLGRK